MDIKDKIEEILLKEYRYIDYVAVHKLLDLFGVSNLLPLADLENRLDEVLAKETPETLNKWLREKRQ